MTDERAARPWSEIRAEAPKDEAEVAEHRARWREDLEDDAP